MNKKHFHLYVTLFLISTLISATMVVAHADSQQTTTITYNALSPEEKNHYTINIPATIEIDEDGGSMQVSIEEGYQLEEDYQVSVSLTEDSFDSFNNALGDTFPTSATTKLNIIKLYLDGDDTSNYYLGLYAKDGNGDVLNSSNTQVALFTSSGTDTSKNGTITFLRASGSSTDKTYKKGGQFTGTLTFDIVGSYY